MDEIILENCRLCYTHPGVHELKTNQELIDQISDILKIKVDDSLQDSLPQKVCEDCCSILNDFKEYQQKIKGIDDSLRHSTTHIPKKIKTAYICYERTTTDENTNFECHVCPSVFNSESALHEHILSHGIDKVVSNFKCKSCNRIYGSRATFKKHSCCKKNVCLHCMQKFKDVEEFDNHVCSEIIEEVMVVDEEDVELEKIILKTEISDSDVKVLYVKEETKEEFVSVNCPYCENTFSSMNELKQHKEEAHKSFKCSWENCDKVFNEKRYLDNHLNKHNDIREFLCETCGKGFLTKTSLRSHERTHVAKKGDFQCEACNKLFKSRCALRLHVRKVHECVRYYCAQCGLSYRSKHSLQRHEMIHTGIKDWPCDLCPKAFYSKKDLARHKRYHLGVRRHKCEECSALFFEKEYLKIHSRIHTGERPYVCNLPDCGKGFIDSYKLKRHQKCKHKHDVKCE